MMKKHFLYLLSITLLSAAMISCAKSTQGKMANEWQVVSSEENSTSVNSDGSKTIASRTTNETSYSSSVTNTNPQGESSTANHSGGVNAFDWLIEKDGSWTRTEEYTEMDSGKKLTYRTVYSGSWSFVGKNKGDDFKKNERVLFNVLAKRYNFTQTEQGATTMSYSSNETYLAGERVLIFTVKESKQKELQLESESGSTVLYDGENQGTNSGKSSFTLKEK
ncbi:hypothetical protein [Fluviicola sp.]|uniref:hypothetical protein n=1 Tax=Fluviicola sp. TaxID=1917219 RepID=UPI0031CEA5E2